MEKLMKQTKLTLFCLSSSIFWTLTAAQAAETGPECRGVAAGVVAGMRASGEVNTQAASEIAILAARRACTAAREDLGIQSSATNASAEAAAKTDTNGDGKFSMWELLSSDQESKPGSKRLKRLRQQ